MNLAADGQPRISGHVTPLLDRRAFVELVEDVLHEVVDRDAPNTTPSTEDEGVIVGISTMAEFSLRETDDEETA